MGVNSCREKKSYLEKQGTVEFVTAVQSKGKVKLSLYLTKHHAMKAYWGVEV
jgi:hypothetical protein